MQSVISLEAPTSVSMSMSISISINVTYRFNLSMSFLYMSVLHMQGITGCVKVVRHRETGKKYAMKMVNMNRVDPMQLEELRNEIELLRGLDHPNIIRLYSTCEQNGFLYLIMEYCAGGELISRWRNQTEFGARDIIFKVCSFVYHFVLLFIDAFVSHSLPLSAVDASDCLLPFSGSLPPRLEATQHCVRDGG